MLSWLNVPDGSTVANSKDSTMIEFPLWNASLDGCKEGLLALRSSDDDADDEVQERQREAPMYDYLNNNGIDRGGALEEHARNPAECFGQGGKDLHADKEGNDKLELVDYKVDPYKEALRMCNLSNGGGDILFRLEHHGCSPTLHTTKCAIFLPGGSISYYCFLPVNFPLSSFVQFRSFPCFNDRFSLLVIVGIVDAATISFLCLFFFGIFSLNYVELMYLDQIELMYYNLSIYKLPHCCT
jgi:hypothetical protein